MSYELSDPRVTNINFLKSTWINHQEKKLWELVQWPPKIKFSHLILFSPFARASSKFPFVMTIGLSITGCSDKENWFDERKQDWLVQKFGVRKSLLGSGRKVRNWEQVRGEKAFSFFYLPLLFTAIPEIFRWRPSSSSKVPTLKCDKYSAELLNR